MTDLDTIKKDHDYVNECFSEMLTLWLKRLPKWSAMVEALKEPAVGFEDLAEQVESMFSDTTDSSPATEITGE